MSVKKQCNHAGCRVLVPYNEKFCEKHERKRNSDYDRYEYRKKIGGKYFKFYKTTQWRKLSTSFRLKNPVCKGCLTKNVIRKADVVDHIQPIRTPEGWRNRLNEDNLQSLCHSCHHVKSQEDKEKYHLN